MAEFKFNVDKLEGAENWAKWKWQMNMCFEHFDLTNIIDGTRKCPELMDSATEEDRVMYRSWVRDNAKAAGIIAGALSKSVSDLVLTYTTAYDIWCKLVSVFEQSSAQRLDLLMEQFFSSVRDPSHDIAAHVARLQKIFMDMNTELRRQGETSLTEKLLIGRIMSTLGPEYHEFRNVWEAMDLENRTLNTLIQKLCAIEIRSIKVTDSNAFVARPANTLVKGKSGGFSGNSEKKVKCFRCGKIGHIKKHCTAKVAKTDRREQYPSKSGENTFLALQSHVNYSVDAWVCDSGASQHMTANKSYFATYKHFASPIDVQLANLNKMRAYGVGLIHVEMRVGDQWQLGTLQNVWYVPDIGKHLFSVRRATEHGYLIQFSKKFVEFKQKQRVVATGSCQNGTYVLNMRVIKPKVAAEVNLSTSSETLQLWHERLGHQGKHHVQTVLKRMSIAIESTEGEFCDGCALGKAHRKSFRTRKNRPTVVGELINADVCGPMSIQSIKGAWYYVCFKDDFSKFRRVFYIRHKNEVAGCLKVFLNEVKTAGHVVKMFLSDGGKEFDCEAVRKVLEGHGITQRIVSPYTPEQNGAAERENRTLVELRRSMLAVSKLPKSLWQQACETAVYILNRTGKTPVVDKAPIELWTGQVFKDLSHLRIFGTSCYVYVPKQFRRKWDDKSIFGHMVGYVNDKDGYQVYVLSTKKIIKSHDVDFKPEQVCNSTFEHVMVHDEPGGAGQLEKEAEETLHNKQEQTETELDSTVIQETLEQRTSKRIKKKPAWQVSGEFVCVAENVMTAVNPCTYTEAVTSKQHDKWRLAMEEEMDALAENETWELVNRPVGKKVLDNRWVLKVKENSEGTKRYRARLVAKGCSQKAGIDYAETFSPVARYDTVRAVLAVTALDGLKLRQFDVKTAFLYGSLQEEVFMCQPEGFDDRSGKVCKLKRSLYGLKQAPRCWNQRLVDFLKNEGFQVSSADPCLFIRRRGEKRLIIVIYVDDGLVAGSDDVEIDGFVKALQSEFKITTGSLDNFLGLQIIQQVDGSIFIHQESYVKKVLERFGMGESNAVSTPSDRSGGGTDTLCDPSVPYREAVGCLMHLSAATRPDIAFAVNKAARSMEQPIRSNWHEVKRIFKYLQGTKEYGLTYRFGNRSLEGFSDADFAGDERTRRSTTGVLIKFADGAVTWTSQLQKMVTLSTTEAEFVAATEGTKELIWLKRLLSDLTDINDTPVLHVDNASAVKLTKKT